MANNNVTENAVKLPSKVIIIEDEKVAQDELARGLEKLNIRVKTAADISSAVYLINAEPFDIAIISMELKTEGGGLVAAQKIRSHPNTDRAAMGIIMMAGSRVRAKADNNISGEIGDIDYVSKPVKIPLLASYLVGTMQRKEALRVAREMQEKILSYKEHWGDFETARGKLLELLPKLGARGPLMLVDLYQTADKIDEAHDLVKDLVTKNPDNIQFLNLMGRILLKQKRLSEARDFMEKADRLAPLKIDRIEKMVDMYLELDEPDKSINMMKTLIKLNPEKPDIKMEMLDKLCEHDYHSHAKRLCEDNVKPSEVVRYYNNKGVLLAKEGKTDLASCNYTRALQFYPTFKENYRIHFNLAVSLYNMKTQESWQEALTHLNACLKLAPTFEKAIKLKQTIDDKVSAVTNGKIKLKKSA